MSTHVLFVCSKGLSLFSHQRIQSSRDIRGCWRGCSVQVEGTAPDPLYKENTTPLHINPALFHGVHDKDSRVIPDVQLPTPLVPIVFRGRQIWIKRDDLLSVDGLSGSKARKFHSLTLPHALDNVDCITSFGGIQSNAMRSLSMFAKAKGVAFVYYSRRRVPEHMWDVKAGNFREAINAGMELRQIPDSIFRQYFERNPLQSACEWIRNDVGRFSSERVLFVPQGGAWPDAEVGIVNLARELCSQIDFLRKDGNLEYPMKQPLVVLPSGTGATALYLAKCLHGKLRVLTVPVAGTERYLAQQMQWLLSNSERTGPVDPCPSSLNYNPMPDILRPRSYVPFADVRDGKLKFWTEMEEAASVQDIHFDLVYAPIVWEELWSALEEQRLDGNRDIVYVHTGGLEGNSSMLDRYVYKGTISRLQCNELMRFMHRSRTASTENCRVEE